MRFSLLQLIVGIAFISTVLELGVNNYRLSKELRFEQRYVQQLEGYSVELRQELANAEANEVKIYESHGAQVNRWIASGELKVARGTWKCVPSAYYPVNFALLKEPVPQRGMNHPKYSR
jgi:hypothetical protein